MSDPAEKPKSAPEPVKPMTGHNIFTLWITIAGLWKTVEVLWYLLRTLARAIA